MPSPLSVRVRPSGTVSSLAMDALGTPAVVTVNVPGTPTVKGAVEGLENVGGPRTRIDRKAIPSGVLPIVVTSSP